MMEILHTIRCKYNEWTIIIEEVLENFKNPPKQNELLLKAAGKGNLEEVKQHLRNGADINYVGWYDQFRSFTTPLGLSSKSGHMSIVRFLIKAGANPYMPYYEVHQMPIYLASNANHKHIVRYLNQVSRLPRILNRIERDGFTPLGHCVLRGYDNRVKHLLNYGADACRIDTKRKTPLIYAVETDNLNLVKLLFEKGANSGATSALKCALDRQRDDIVKYIIHNKRELVNVHLKDGYTPLTKSLQMANAKIARYLIKNGANLSMLDRKNKTPLDVALEMYSLQMAEMLIKNGARVPRELSLALFNKISKDGHVDIYQFLLKHNWNVDQVGRRKKTSLALSASNEFLLLTQLLIEHGANVTSAKREINIFRKKNIDFDTYMRRLDYVPVSEKWDIMDGANESGNE